MSKVQETKPALTQIFKVSVPEGVSGMYATSLDLFFRKKSKSFGVEVCIVEVTDGQPDPKKVLPNCLVIMAPESINVSETGTVATNFKFDQPTFLSADQRYAFVVRALGGSPDYELWTGINGSYDVSTGKAISSNPLSESAYFSKTTSDWAEIPNEDLKYKLYRAKFNINQDSRVVLKKKANEILQLKNVLYSSGNPEIAPGDEIYVRDANGLRDPSKYAKVLSYDSVNNMMFLTDSTGQFTKDAVVVIVRSDTEGAVKPDSAFVGQIASAEINNMLDFPAHAVVPKLGDQTNTLGTMNLQFRGTIKRGFPLISVKESSEADWKAIANQQESEFTDTARYILSRSTEVSELQGNSSVEIRGTLSSNNDFISPVLNMKESSIIAIKNLVNANTSGEEGDYGSAQTKYISKIVTLADGQEAEDLKVYITAYKPPRTVIQVYAKVWNAEDSEEFDLKKWTLLDQVTEPTLFSDPKNVDDYREYEFDIPNAPPVPGAAWSPLITDPLYGDPIQYIGPNGTYIGFKKFSIKVVMAVQNDSDAYLYPRLSDVRAIALQK